MTSASCAGRARPASIGLATIGLMTELRPIERRPDYAVVRGADAYATPAALFDALEKMRDDGRSHVVVVDLPGWLKLGWEPAETRVLGDHVVPLVAAWSGELSPAAFAAGLWCDIRVAEEGTTFPRLGRLDGETRARLERVVGMDDEAGLARALSGEALQSGLVSEWAARGEARATAEELAVVIASRGPIAVQLAKEAIWRGLEMPLAQALRFETDLTLLLQTTKDRAEGVRAFVDKRAPRFKGE